MSNTEYTLQDVVGALNNIDTSLDNLTIQQTNDFQNTIGDELHFIEHQLTRIADALEKIADK